LLEDKLCPDWNKIMKLLYSVDEQVWYWQMQGPTDWRCSQTFSSEKAVRHAYKFGALVFR
jgi:hypothetical protein